MHKLLAQLKAARSMPAGLVAAKLMRRAGLRTAAVRRMELLANPQNQDSGRLTRLYLEFAALAADKAAWAPIDFAGKRMLEVGCGPLAGLAPLAIAAGAARYTGVDPGANAQQLFHRDVVARHLMPAIEEAHTLARAHGLTEAPAAPGLDGFRNRVGLVAGGLEDIAGEGSAGGAEDAPFDIALSISCLEHIGDLPAALKALRARLRPGGRQLHLVNFSNHLDKAAPFKHLYDLSPDEHRRRYGRHINLLRPDDIHGAFRDAGFDATLLPVDVRPEAVPADGALDAWWRDRYPRAALAIRTALILA